MEDQALLLPRSAVKVGFFFVSFGSIMRESVFGFGVDFVSLLLV